MWRLNFTVTILVSLITKEYKFFCGNLVDETLSVEILRKINCSQNSISLQYLMIEQ